MVFPETAWSLAREASRLLPGLIIGYSGCSRQQGAETLVRCECIAPTCPAVDYEALGQILTKAGSLEKEVVYDPREVCLGFAACLFFGLCGYLIGRRHGSARRRGGGVLE